MIREYEEKDADAIVETWFKASLLAHPFLKPSFLESEKATIRNVYLPMVDTWVAETDGAVVGFISLLGDEVRALFVDPAHHGRKLGKALMDRAVRERGSVRLDVFRDNPIGRRFYERYGFRQDYEHVDEQTGHPVVRMSFPAI